ncbi:MAG: hypothetical protein QOF77_1990 [Solirubrobacteraceae bacterium]|jgi:PKD repeat protein|nr:hypothetical protein [Solirubrobacteraceae bacterium]
MDSERLTRPGIRRIRGAGPPRGLDRPSAPDSPSPSPRLCAVVLSAAILLAAAPSAWAGAGLTITTEFPASLTAGQTGVPAAVSVTNASSGTEGGQSITLSAITLVAACATQAISGADCPAAAIEPGALRLPASAVGEVGTGCAGTTFALVLIDAVQGKYRLTPGAPVVLGPRGSPTAACVIDIAFDVVAPPTRDADPAKLGKQTDQIAFALGASTDGQPAGAFGTAETTVTADESPVAAYTPSTYSPTVGQTVSFDGTASADPDGTIVSLRWVWGDGTPDGTGLRPTHVFTVPGLRSVGLYVTDSDGRTAAVGHGVTVGDELPTAAYAPTTYAPAAGQSVSFDAGASLDPDGTMVSFRWVWGDGTPDASGVTATHVFATAGVRSVGLYATDSDGRTGAVGHTIVVAP